MAALSSTGFVQRSVSVLGGSGPKCVGLIDALRDGVLGVERRAQAARIVAQYSGHISG